MNDYERMKQIFEELHIKFESESLDNGGYYIHLPQGTGYYGFYCEFRFNKDGKFIEYGVWE